MILELKMLIDFVKLPACNKSPALVLDGVYGKLDAADTVDTERTTDERAPAPAVLAPTFLRASAPTHAASLLQRTRQLRQQARL